MMIGGVLAAFTHYLRYGRKRLNGDEEGEVSAAKALESRPEGENGEA